MTSIDFFMLFGVATVMILITNLIFYELLRFTWYALPRLTFPPRVRVSLVVLILLAGHTIVIWTYAILYWFLAVYQPHEIFGDFGVTTSFAGTYDASFTSILYFSTVTYTSLGYGDIVPRGPLRLLAGSEVLNGLVLIGWSVSFTYLTMLKFWDQHPRRRRGEPVDEE